MGCSYYHPHERFMSIHHPGDLIVIAIESLMKFLPAGDAMTDVGSIFGDMKEIYQVIAKLDDAEKAKGPVLYLKLSYLPENGMTVVGNEHVSFGDILKLMEEMAKAKIQKKL